MGPITWESIPNPDGWGPDSYWSCTEWVQFHKALVAQYGREEADRIWIGYYDKASWGAHEISCATTSNEFRSYVIGTGLADKSSILSRVYRAEGGINETLEPVKELTGGIGDGVESIGKILKWLPWVALGIVLIGGAMYARSLGFLKWSK